MGYTRKASRSRSRKGGSKPDGQIEVDIEHGFGPKETASSLMEKGRSMSPPGVPTQKQTIIRPSPIKIDRKTAIINEEVSQMEQGKSKFSPKSKGAEMLGGRKRKSRKAKKTKKHFRKGSPSKTRKGRKDFVTHKGDKKFHRRGHRQSKPQKKKSMIAQLLGL
tara:strand:+ start:184 stop:672 length:489 start_codon:yes stop_codon:yes gene_type:complete